MNALPVVLVPLVVPVTPLPLVPAVLEALTPTPEVVVEDDVAAVAVVAEPEAVLVPEVAEPVPGEPVVTPPAVAVEIETVVPVIATWTGK